MTKLNGWNGTGILKCAKHTHTITMSTPFPSLTHNRLTHTCTQSLRLDRFIFCLVGRWVCQFKVPVSICKWLHCLTLVWLCSMDQVLQMRASPVMELYGWASILIPAGELACLSAVSLCHSLIWFGGLNQACWWKLLASWRQLTLHPETLWAP